MVPILGFCRREEAQVQGLVKRFAGDGHPLAELAAIEKADIPGYNGKVVPQALAGGRFEMVMLLASVSPFTVAHELAHVADISTRREESRDNILGAMPIRWHLAHRMSTEYYANRVACAYAGDPEILAAFKSDATGLTLAARKGDWADFLIYYALLLGIVHAHGRLDCEPLQLLAPLGVELPPALIEAMGSFRASSPPFFEDHPAGLYSAGPYSAGTGRLP